MKFGKSEHLILSPSSDRHSDHKLVVSPLSNLSVLICKMVMGRGGGLDLVIGEGNSNPLQYSCLGNTMDGGAW